jgi:hypothetical protein
VAWSPDGTQLASGSDGHDIRIWSVTEGVLLGILVALADGWAVLGSDGFTYKYAGTVNREFWWSIGLCPFGPGELDPYYSRLERLAIGTPLTEFDRSRR